MIMMTGALPPSPATSANGRMIGRNDAATEEEFRDGYIVASRNLEEQKDDFFRRDYDVEKKHMVVLNRGACPDPGRGRH
ncbi:hypothetical protein NDS46_00510 [Paenibacillus thiaminolyticus]|uniref:hypothetical protein n=1 Tax=Paenibacillus thiaminolyticus TaxID=49283 RepID=UPI00232F4E4D|nr:hypothetical protein [Paenibacillus thiaminolyticus]WCF08462.1 hypothetical protein NDS46_00510 [Paenibacillus thiaminolyticus]